MQNHFWNWILGVSTTKSRKFWGTCSAETCRSQNYMWRDKTSWRWKRGDSGART